MDGKEQIGLVAAGNTHTLAQGNEDIAVAGQVNLIAAVLFKNFFQLAGHSQGNVFFINAGTADGAGILSAMSGIKNNNPFGIAVFGNCGIAAFGGTF